jgi:hypothetical protein
MEDIPDIIKQLHLLVHGDDGTGGLHGVHRGFTREFDNTEFPEDLEGAKPKQDNDERNINGMQSKKPNAKAVKESNEQKLEQNEEDEQVDKPPMLLRSELNREQQQGEMTKKRATEIEKYADHEMSNMGEAAGITSRPLFTRADPMNKAFVKGKALNKQFADDADETGEQEDNTVLAKDHSPTNVAQSEQDDLYYPHGEHDEGPNQIETNPYNETEKVHVPAPLKQSLKKEIDLARSASETFEIRRDWDSKNFYTDMANAFQDLYNKLDKGTIYGMKEAQILMTSMMNIYTSKLPPDVVKFIAGGGAMRPLKDYLKQVSGDFDKWHIHPSSTK